MLTHWLPSILRKKGMTLGMEHGLLRVPLASDDVMPGLVKMVVEAGGEVLEARMAGAHLEQLYLEIVEGRS